MDSLLHLSKCDFMVVTRGSGFKTIHKSELDVGLSVQLNIFNV